MIEAEAGGHRFLRNVGAYPLNYMVSHPNNVFLLFHLNSVRGQHQNCRINLILVTYLSTVIQKYIQMQLTQSTTFSTNLDKNEYLNNSGGFNTFFNYLKYLETCKKYALVMKTVSHFSLNICFEICLVPKRNYRVF